MKFESVHNEALAATIYIQDYVSPSQPYPLKTCCTRRHSYYEPDDNAGAHSDSGLSVMLIFEQAWVLKCSER